MQFIHDIRPEKAGSRTTRPSLPVTEEQKLALGGFKMMLLLWPDCSMPNANLTQWAKVAICASLIDSNSKTEKSTVC